MVTLQLCALSSRAGQHAEALEEALKAVLEAEEVWSAMHHGTTSEVSSSWSPNLVSRALAALVQAKHCVAIELEYNLAEKTRALGRDLPEADMIREQMIPSLHREASALARRLPSSSALRRLSERTQAQEAARRGSELEDSVEEVLPIAGGPLGVAQAPGMAWPEDRRATMPASPPLAPVLALASPSQGLQRRRASQLPSQVAQSISRGMESPNVVHRQRPRSAPSSFSMVRIQKLEEQALDPPTFEDFRLPNLELPLLQEPPVVIQSTEKRSEGGLALCGPDEIVAGSVGAPAKGNRKGNTSKATGAERFKRSEETGDVFQDWLESNRARLPKGDGSRMSEDMLKSLKEGFKTRYRRFQEELPFFSAQDLYENKIMFSHYGMKIRNQAKKDAKGAKSSEKMVRSKSEKSKGAKSQAQNQSLHSVRALATMLQQSHDNHPHAREFYKYLGRPWRDEEIFESLRQAFQNTKEDA